MDTEDLGKDRENSVGTGISLCLGEQTQFHATAELGLNLFYGDLEQDWIFLKMAMNIQRGGHGIGKARVGGTQEWALDAGPDMKNSTVERSTEGRMRVSL